MAEVNFHHPELLQIFKHRIKPTLVRTLWGFGKEELLTALRRLDVAPGDTLMVHSSFTPDSGFTGTPQDVIETLMRAVETTGTIVMMSMPYHGISSFDHLRSGKPFNVGRSVSMVGIVTEVFRRRPDVVRSTHPTHPVAAWGAHAAWLTSEQAPSLSPFAEAGIFHKLAEANAKALLYNVPFNTLTFEHYLEHKIKNHLPVPLYRDELALGVVIDHHGVRRSIPTLVLSDEINSIRRTDILERQLWRRRILHRRKVGRGYLVSGRLQLMLDTVVTLAAAGWTFHRPSLIKA